MTAGSGLASALSLLPDRAGRNVIRGGADGVSPLAVKRRTLTDVADLGSFLAEDGATVLLRVDSSGRLNGAVGDEQLWTSVHTTGQKIDLRKGTAAAPDTSPHPLIKATRTMRFAAGSLAGAGGEANSSIYGIGVSLDPGAYQPVGILGDGLQYSMQSSQSLDTVIVAAGGSGYTVGDTLTVQGGTVATPVLLTVTAVNGSGAVTAVTVADIGAYTVAPTEPVGVTGGTGTGATFTLTFTQIPAVDAIGVMGRARAMVDNSAIGVQGGYFTARRDHAGPALTCVEIQCQNFSVDDVYLANGSHKTHGLRFHVQSHLSACAMEVQRTRYGAQWDVGLGFPQGVGGSPVASACIRADNTAPMMLYIASAGAAAFTTASIAIADGNNAGVVGNPVLIGQTATRFGSQANAYLVVASSNDSDTDAMAWFGSAGGSFSHRIEFRNGVSRFGWFLAGAANKFLAGTIAGDSGMRILIDTFSYHIGGHGRIITAKRDTGNVDKLSFFAGTPVAKPTITGSRSDGTALASAIAALAALNLATDTSTP